ncbi:MAG: SDR family NAD(P)-dependent oxidoreductase [Deltaproteobacteria bacterium]|nr:SDR family NAD(P)-dependent oxidoreductase [Deltaproteobacteria bacterium]
MNTETLTASQTALITGAGTGIGRALAVLLALRGYNLILMARSNSRLEELKAILQARHPAQKIHVVPSDVTDHERHMLQIKEACSHFATLDLLIANAGIGYKTNEWENTWVHSLHTFQTNLLGAVATIEAGKDIMLRQGFGHIVGISSIASIRGLPQTSAYCASKAAFSVFMESLRTDVCANHIAVTSIHPGFIKTPMTEKNGSMPWLMSAEKAADKIYRAIKKKKTRYFFPWQMMIFAKLCSLTPDFIFDLAMKLTRKRVRAFKKNRV